MAPLYTQKGRPIRVDTPFGADVLLLERIECEEAVSEQYGIVLHTLSTEMALDPKKILRQAVTVTVELVSGGQRYFHGIVKRFVQLGKADGLVSYQVEVVPRTWLLSLSTDCRIYQQKSVPDIIKSVFGDFGITDFKVQLSGQYSPREYCVQYRETHLDFISRLMEEEGIFYFFEHAKDKHTIVLADSTAAVKAGPLAKVPANSSVYDADSDMIHALNVDSEVVSGKVTLVDYNDTMPKRFESSASAIQSTAFDKLKRFDYPGKFAAVSEGDRLARLRMEEVEALGSMVHGATSYRGLATGQKLDVFDHYRKDANVSYHVLQASHEASVGGYHSGDFQFDWKTTFQAIPHSVSYRPPRRTPKAVVQGTQTALVVGPAGEEIYVDKYGRVKVQFFWDQLGQKDDKSSCWVRVSSSWAGKSWGFIMIPRIGQEVIVDFLEGDPDRPIITGRVYNAEQMPPWSLPDNSSQSGLQTRSTKAGGAANHNQLRFEDKKGSEQVHLHAEKNFDVEVENDETHWVGHDRKKTIDNDELTHVKGLRTETVDKDETITIQGKRTEHVEKDETVTVNGNRGVTIAKNDTLLVQQGDSKHTVETGKYIFTVKGNREIVVQDGNDTTKVSKGNQSTVVSMGNVETKVSMGNVDTKVDMGNVSLKAGLGSIKYDAMGGIELKVGANSIKIDQSGITIKGMMVKIQGDVMTEVKGLMTTVKADAIMTVKGSLTMIN